MTCSFVLGSAIPAWNVPSPLHALTFLVKSLTGRVPPPVPQMLSSRTKPWVWFSRTSAYSTAFLVTTSEKHIISTEKHHCVSLSVTSRAHICSATEDHLHLSLPVFLVTTWEKHHYSSLSVTSHAHIWSSTQDHHCQSFWWPHQKNT